MDDSSWWWNHNRHFRTMVTVMVTVMMTVMMRGRMVMVRMVMVMMIMTYVMCNVSPHCSVLRLVMLLISFSL